MYLFIYLYATPLPNPCFCNGNSILCGSEMNPLYAFASIYFHSARHLEAVPLCVVACVGFGGWGMKTRFRHVILFHSERHLEVVPLCGFWWVGNEYALHMVKSDKAFASGSSLWLLFRHMLLSHSEKGTWRQYPCVGFGGCLLCAWWASVTKPLGAEHFYGSGGWEASHTVFTCIYVRNHKKPSVGLVFHLPACTRKSFTVAILFQRNQRSRSLPSETVKLPGAQCSGGFPHILVPDFLSDTDIVV